MPLVYVIDQGIHKVKSKVALIEKPKKKFLGFSFSINIANFDAFLSVFKLTKNPLFLKSAEGIVKVKPIDKNSKRMKMIEKQALNVSNITGFDHIEEQKIKKEIKTEVKIEPMDENFNE